jgi:AraC family transcriptional regulator of adaptative response/methylated-DNA-[protein]-cysteine methyltransferase
MRYSDAMSDQTRGQPHPLPAPQAYGDDEGRWQAVIERDEGADGSFFYSVKTTGVVCRPSCRSRPPKRANVAFHATLAAALAAGFRPCKRCRPEAPDVARRRAGVVARACRLIADAETAPSLDALSAAVGVSPFHFHRMFKAVMGITPKAYIDAERTRKLRGELDSGASVTSAIYGAGYSSSSRFYEKADARLGMSARTYQAGGAGAEIRFAVGQCSLGAILIAATPRGICAIELGDDPQTLVHTLEDRFPKARVIGADRDFEQLVARVVGAVEAPAGTLDLPLDVRGTAFQERVWQALRAIPAGTTATYAEIAARIGQPSAVRAVAQACAANPAAIAIPCHRVVRTDGGLGGYRWGVERKDALLKREAA